MLRIRVHILLASPHLSTSLRHFLSEERNSLVTASDGTKSSKLRRAKATAARERSVAAVAEFAAAFDGAAAGTGLAAAAESHEREQLALRCLLQAIGMKAAPEAAGA